MIEWALPKRQSPCNLARVIHGKILSNGVFAYHLDLPIRVLEFVLQRGASYSPFVFRINFLENAHFAISFIELAAEFAAASPAGATIEQDFGNANAVGLTSHR
jgi:hypothetical protein